MNYLIDFSSEKAQDDFETFVDDWTEWEVEPIENSSHFLLKTGKDRADMNLYQLLLAHNFFTEAEKS